MIHIVTRLVFLGVVGSPVKVRPKCVGFPLVSLENSKVSLENSKPTKMGYPIAKRRNTKQSPGYEMGIVFFEPTLVAGCLL